MYCTRFVMGGWPVWHPSSSETENTPENVIKKMYSMFTDQCIKRLPWKFQNWQVKRCDKSIFLFCRAANRLHSDCTQTFRRAQSKITGRKVYQKSLVHDITLIRRKSNAILCICCRLVSTYNNRNVWHQCIKADHVASGKRKGGNFPVLLSVLYCALYMLILVK